MYIIYRSNNQTNETVAAEVFFLYCWDVEKPDRIAMFVADSPCGNFAPLQNESLCQTPTSCCHYDSF